MMRGAALVGSVCALTGCVFQPRPFDPPARLQLGVRDRHFQTPVAQQTPITGAIARTTSPPSSEVTEGHEAVMGTAQFTMATRQHLYFGGEVEAGTLDTPGSNAAGAYGVAGLEGTSRIGSLAAELTAGWRTMRTGIDTDDVDSFAFEPRVRGDIWLGPQVTLGGLAGASLGGDTHTWMAGVFVAFHSHPFGTRP